MDKDEALKLASEALKAYHYAMIDAGVLNRQGVLDQGFTAWSAAEKALAQPAPVQDPVALGGDWTPCMKLPVVVHVRQQRPGESHVSTREGITPVKPDDLIMRGVSGEEYPIGRAIFEQTYTLHPNAPATQRQPDAYCVTRGGGYTGWLLRTLPEAEDAVRRLSKSYPDELYAFEPVYLAEPDQPDAVGWMVPGYKNAFSEWEEASMYCDGGQRPVALYPARSVAAAPGIAGVTLTEV